MRARPPHLGVQTLTRSRSAIIFNSLLTTAFVLAGDISFLISFMGVYTLEPQAAFIRIDTGRRHHRVLGRLSQSHRPSVPPHPWQFPSWERGRQRGSHQSPYCAHPSRACDRRLDGPLLNHSSPRGGIGLLQLLRAWRSHPYDHHSSSTPGGKLRSTLHGREGKEYKFEFI